MVALAASLFSTITGGGAAAAGATAAGTAATSAIGVGSTISSILQGTASLLGVFSGIGAANTEASSMELAANDAEREKALETLQGVDRRTSIKRALMDSVGAQSTAYAASGVDLTFGTPAQARKEAYREADLGIETSNGTELTRVSRLDERAANLRARAKSTRRAGVLSGVGGALGTAADILNRG